MRSHRYLRPAHLRSVAIGLLLGACTAAAQECTLFPTRVYNTGAWPSYGRLVDLNRDGHLDFICESYEDRRISIHFGTGGGEFAPETIVPIDPAPEALHVADMDHDGDTDVLIKHSPGTGMSSLLNRGDGTFDPPLALSFASSVFIFALRDVNGDNFPDIVGSAGFTNAGIYLGDGAGGFTLAQTLHGSSSSSTVGAAVEDLDGDGYIDVAFANSSTLYVYRNLLNTGFADVEYYNVAPSGVYRLTGADVDGDGRGDLIFRIGDTLAIRGSLGRLGGGGPLQFWESQVPGIGLCDDFRFHDFDGDADLDIFAGAYDNTRWTGRNLHLVRNDGSRQFTLAATTPAGWGIAGFDVGDLDGDGAPDVVSTSVGIGQRDLVVIRNHAGVLETNLRVVFSSGSDTFFADFNRDGRIDVLGADSSRFSVQLNDGAGGFLALPWANTAASQNSRAAGDLDGDGNVDLAYCITDGRAYIHRGNGDGTFGPPVLRLMATVAASMCLADVDHDGLPDLVTAGGANLYIRRNLGGLAFQPSTAYPTVIEATELIPADFNGDGRDDILASRSTSGIRLLLGNANGGLGAAGPLYSGPIASCSAADIDGDGDLDVLINLASSFRLLRNAGDATFAVETYAYPATGVTVYGVDLNGDGRAELYASHGVGRFSLLGGIPEPLTIISSHAIDLGSRPEAHDLDGDGDLDLFCRAGGGAAIVRNIRSGILAQPQDAAARVGDTITLTVGLESPADWECQWSRNGIPLTDGPSAGGGEISGSTQPTLVIDGAGAADSGEYAAVLTDGCSTLRTRRVHVSVTYDPCLADLDQDGSIGLGDLSQLLSHFGAAATGPEDLDGDGSVGLGDLTILLSLFGQSC